MAQRLRVREIRRRPAKLLFQSLWLGHISLKDCDAAVVGRIDAILDPFAQRLVVVLVRRGPPLAHGLTKQLLVRRVGKLVPQDLPDHRRRILAERAQLLLRLRIEFRVTPVSIEGVIPVGHAIADRLAILLAFARITRRITHNASTTLDRFGQYGDVSRSISSIAWFGREREVLEPGGAQKLA